MYVVWVILSSPPGSEALAVKTAFSIPGALISFPGSNTTDAFPLSSTAFLKIFTVSEWNSLIGSSKTYWLYFSNSVFVCFRIYSTDDWRFFATAPLSHFTLRVPFETGFDPPSISPGKVRFIFNLFGLTVSILTRLVNVAPPILN